MTERQLWFLGGAGAGLAFVVWKWGNPVVAAQIAEQWAVNLVGRGNKLSESTLDDDGVIEEVPSVLTDMASAVLGFDADTDTYSLARAGRSEGVDGMEYRMHVILNMLDADQARYGTGIYSSVTMLAIHSKNATADGHYSKQGLGKPFSTSKDPYESDYALAQKVRADHAAGTDPTGGAVKFVDKSGPFSLDGEPATYDDIVAAWAKEGLIPDDTLPNATSNFVVFRKA
jgi:hypothetical protein